MPTFRKILFHPVLVLLLLIALIVSMAALGWLGWGLVSARSWTDEVAMAILSLAALALTTGKFWISCLFCCPGKAARLAFTGLLAFAAGFSTHYWMSGGVTGSILMASVVETAIIALCLAVPVALLFAKTYNCQARRRA